MTDVEQILEANEQVEHLKTLREYDCLNRIRILNSRPIYGKDLRKAVKVQLLVSNLYQKPVKYCTGEVPSTIFNTVASSVSGFSKVKNTNNCKCEDLDNNTIPPGCSGVLECNTKKPGDRKRAKKLPSFAFDPAKYSEFDQFFGEYANEDKRLVITIDLDFVPAAPAPVPPTGPSEEPKGNPPPVPINVEEEAKNPPVPQQPQKEPPIVIPEETPAVAATTQEENKTGEAARERTENSVSSGEFSEGESGSQSPSRENLLSDISDNDNSEPLLSENEEKEEEGFGENAMGRYLTRSKKRAIEGGKPVEDNNNKVSNGTEEVAYNGVTVELIPARFLDAMDQNEEGDGEEGKDVIMENEEDDKADQGKFFAYRYTDTIKDMIKQPNQRQKEMNTTLRQFKVIQPKTLGVGVQLWPSSYSTIYRNEDSFFRVAYRRLMSAHFVQRALRIGNFLTFPDRKLIQYDSGKLQKMSLLLKRLKAQNSKVLIFTQMSKMLDIIEGFLNLHGYTYVRLDGSIKVETRQAIVDRFNNDPRIFCFISSTRCGGIGINLTAADAVIFYDSDWNPAMDKQAQDRCHRIGQTKTVHIYRLITLNTIEENIFKKSLQKREIGGLIMEDGQFDTDFFKKIDFKEVVEEEHLIKKPKPGNILQKENIHIEHIKDDKDTDPQNKGELMKKLEDALIVVEDQEDVQAAQNAKKEIVDEFEFSEHEAGPENEGAQKPAAPPKKVETEFKKNELIDWENDQNLSAVTKKSLEFYQRLHPFDEFYNARSVSDKRFIPEEEEEQEEEEKGEEGENEDESSSESVNSDTECDELPASVKLEAMQAYEEAKKLVALAKEAVPTEPAPMQVGM